MRRFSTVLSAVAAPAAKVEARSAKVDRSFLGLGTSPLELPHHSLAQDFVLRYHLVDRVRSGMWRSTWNSRIVEDPKTDSWRIGR
jgi:hypothetical protein